MQETSTVEISLRSPDVVMTPDRIGVFQPTAVSFARLLTRKMLDQKWTVRCEDLDISLQNEGQAIYAVEADGHRYSFLVLAKHIDDSTRTDRAVAQGWDFTFCLHEGEFSESDLTRLRENMPLQSSGRFLSCDLVFARGNKSARQMERVIDTLASGTQPDPDWFQEVGYLIRTSAVYGNGAAGIADYKRLQSGGPLNMPYAAQMLTVYLIRQFSIDYVNHLAAKLSANAVPLAREFCRHCGVGNATGLGMAPFVFLHPQLIGRWVEAREYALAQVKIRKADPEILEKLTMLIDRASKHMGQLRVDDVREKNRIACAEDELSAMAIKLSAEIAGYDPCVTMNDVLKDLIDDCSSTTRESLNSMLIELFPDTHHAEGMDCDEIFSIVPEMTVDDMQILIEENYGWATSIPFDDAEERSMFWYRSQVASEPRLGTRGLDGYEERALPIEIAHDIYDLNKTLHQYRDSRSDGTIAEFLLEYPKYRSAVQRVHSTRKVPFGEVRVNSIATGFFPLDVLRLKLSLLGANRFDPKSDRWLRVTFFQGAPLSDEFDEPNILEKELFPVLDATSC